MRLSGKRPTLREAGLFVAGLAVLLLLNLAGEELVRATRLPVPGSVVGMLVLTILLELRLIPVPLIRQPAELLVRHLALLYVPAGVALIAWVGVVRHDLLPITVAALASLVAVLAVVGLIVQRMERDP